MLRHSSQQYLLGKPASEKQIVLSSILGMLYPVCLKWNSLVDDVIARLSLSVADPGEGRGVGAPPSIFLDQPEPRRAEKRFLGDRRARGGGGGGGGGGPSPPLPSISRSGSDTVYLIKEMRGGCVTAG